MLYILELLAREDVTPAEREILEAWKAELEIEHGRIVLY